MKITTNSVVSLDYTLKSNEGEILDTSNGRAPLVYLHGVGALIPGLENELEGLEKGAKKSVTVQPEEAYGTKSDDLLHVVPASGFQGNIDELQIGVQVQLDTEQGPAIATIAKIENDEVTLDLNHPLAGVVLNFEVEIVDVRTATADEIAHGHVHGEGGHHH